jgi:predicted ribosomally synthesized peptide with nif11-like leader
MSPTANDNLAQFYKMVQEDAALRQKLEGVPDKQSFVRLAVQLGKERGYGFGAADVEASFVEPPAGALTDDDLEQVAGGVVSDGRRGCIVVIGGTGPYVPPLQKYK